MCSSCELSGEKCVCNLNKIECTMRNTTPRILNMNEFSFNLMTTNRLALVDLTIRNKVYTRVLSALNNFTKAIVSLTMYQNTIQTLHADSFKYLAIRKAMNLQENEIQELEPGAFSGLPSLTQLQLQSNNLKFIRNGTFNTLESIFIINLNSNQN